MSIGVGGFGAGILGATLNLSIFVTTSTQCIPSYLHTLPRSDSQFCGYTYTLLLALFIDLMTYTRGRLRSGSCNGNHTGGVRPGPGIRMEYWPGIHRTWNIGQESGRNIGRA